MRLCSKGSLLLYRMQSLILNVALQTANYFKVHRNTITNTEIQLNAERTHFNINTRIRFHF
jgi:hypothetical protein